jgi:hypothetical protein
MAGYKPTLLLAGWKPAAEGGGLYSHVGAERSVAVRGQAAVRGQTFVPTVACRNKGLTLTSRNKGLTPPLPQKRRSDPAAPTETKV